MFVLRRRSPAELDTLLSRAVKEDPSYPEVGATGAEVMPPGYRHDRHVRRIGDSQVFDRAVTGLHHWVAHEGASIRIFPHDQSVSLDATFIGLISLGVGQLVAPCRIVRVIDQSDKFGFACATLPGHPARGEEAFVVERRSDGTFFSIIAFSRPADRLARLAGPFGRAVQLAITGRCLNAVARYVQSSG